MTRWWGWVVVGALIAGSAGLGITAATLIRAQVDRRPLEVKRLTPEERERQEIIYSVRTTGPVPAAKVKLDLQRTADGWEVEIEAETADAKLATVLSNARGLFRALAGTGVKVAAAGAVFRTSALHDLYGRPMKDLVIARIGFGAQTWRKMDWTGFDPRNFPQVADEYWVHELLQEQPLPSPRESDPASLTQERQEQKSGEGGN